MDGYTFEQFENEETISLRKESRIKLEEEHADDEYEEDIQHGNTI